MKFDYSKNLNYDIISLGEVMLRLDPGDGRIRNARSFTVWEGGGEYNVSRAFVKCFKKRSAIITSLVENEIGYLVKDLILQGGVNTELIHWLDFDGSGKSSRNGIYFLEKGFGVRGALGCSDRGNTAISQLRHDNIDWEYVFGKLGSKWFHTGGIYAGLSKNAPKVIVHAMKSAKKYGAVCTPDFFGYNKDLELQYRGRFRELKDLKPINNGESDLKIAMKMVAKTNKGPDQQIPSMGCNIKWFN